MHRKLSHKELLDIAESLMKNAEKAHEDSKHNFLGPYWDGRADAYHHMIMLLEGRGFDKDILSEELNKIGIKE
jgi:hypothetical protein